jgi:hypothetical protein
MSGSDWIARIYGMRLAAMVGAINEEDGRAFFE